MNLVKTIMTIVDRKYLNFNNKRIQTCDALIVYVKQRTLVCLIIVQSHKM